MKNVFKFNNYNDPTKIVWPIRLKWENIFENTFNLNLTGININGIISEQWRIFFVDGFFHSLVAYNNIYFLNQDLNVTVEYLTYAASSIPQASHDIFKWAVGYSLIYMSVFSNNLSKV